MSLAAESRIAAHHPRRRSTSDDRERVLVVGGGAAAVLAAFNLAAAGLRPVVIADGCVPGHGVAYATMDPLHRLNVPAGRMSVCPDDPNAFVRWAQAQVDSSAESGDFLPRAWYGDYLASVLADLVSAGRAEVRRGRAVSLSRSRRADSDAPLVHVALPNGRTLSAPAAVLAVGCPPPQADWAPAALAADPRLVVDPWAPGMLAEIAGDPVRPREVLLVGAGLTMVDVALSIAARNPHARITAVSRSGLLPTGHLHQPSSPIPTPEPPGGQISLEAAREVAAESIGLAVRMTGDWRPGIDALRPITPALWAALSWRDRAKFLREDRRRWDVLRHRMAPQIAETVSALRDSGRLRVEALGYRCFADYPWRRFDSVVSCTGQSGQLSADPLLAEMLANGSVRPDPLGLGLDCDEQGHPIARDGLLWSEVSVIGALRRGQLWESTAIPELRAQAHDLAARLATRMSLPTLVN